MEEHTSNGIMYEWELAGSQGASFVLYPEPRHTPEDIKAAKAEIRDNQDVVSIRVATENDRDHYYKKLYFRDPRTRPLAWYEIEQDEKLIRQERLKGTTPENFVTQFVILRIDEVRKENIKKFGTQIL